MDSWGFGYVEGSEERHAENCWGVLPKRAAKGSVCSVIQGAAGWANSQLITSPFLQSLRGLFRARWTGGFGAQIVQFYSFAVENKSWEIKTSLLCMFFHLIRYGHVTNWLCNLGNHAQMLGFAAAFSDQILVFLELAGTAGANPAHWGCRVDWLNALINLPEPDPDVFSCSSMPRIWKALLWVGVGIKALVQLYIHSFVWGGKWRNGTSSCHVMGSLENCFLQWRTSSPLCHLLYWNTPL